MKNKSFLAFDLGATSGRSILGTLENGRLQMKELTRFPNQMLQIGKHFHWNIYSLFEHFKAALAAVKQEGVEISSIGIDTWGVDFALIAKDGTMLGAPYAYRDPHTQGMPEKFFEIVSREKVYGLTGIQVMNFNSLFQLFALRQNNSSLLEAASEMLFMPDIPARVTLNEYLELAKSYSSPESKSFINGILDKVMKESGKTA